MSQTPTLIPETNDWTIDISLRINDETKRSLRCHLPRTPKNEGASIQVLIKKFAEYVGEQYE